MYEWTFIRELFPLKKKKKLLFQNPNQRQIFCRRIYAEWKKNPNRNGKVARRLQFIYSIESVTTLGLGFVAWIKTTSRDSKAKRNPFEGEKREKRERALFLICLYTLRRNDYAFQCRLGGAFVEGKWNALFHSTSRSHFLLVFLFCW